MNTENIKTNEPHRFKLDLADKINPNKNMALANLSIYYTWNDTFDLPDGSYSISDIQNYFEFIIKKT